MAAAVREGSQEGASKGRFLREMFWLLRLADAPATGTQYGYKSNLHLTCVRVYIIREMYLTDTTAYHTLLYIFFSM